MPILLFPPVWPHTQKDNFPSPIQPVAFEPQPENVFFYPMSTAG